MKIDHTQKYMTPEWYPQDSIQLTWPHRNTDWGPRLKEVYPTFIRIAQAIVRSTPLLIVTPNPATVKRSLLEHGVDLSMVTFADMHTNDTWARDHGGLSVFENGRLKLLDFRFNGWGLKFPANFDNQITKNLSALKVLKGDYVNCQDFVLEGGSIEVDGEGSLMTTTSCLLAPNRNDAYNKQGLEDRLKGYFGVKQVLWLESGLLDGDDTDGHIDTLARFCPNRTILYVKCYNKRDYHYNVLKDMESELQDFRTLQGEPYHLLPLPMADPIYDKKGKRLPATYANFLVLADMVLVPTYNSPLDSVALGIVAEAFPLFEVVGIDCRQLILQGGSLHCVTMQYPRQQPTSEEDQSKTQDKKPGLKKAKTSKKSKPSKL